MKGNPKSLLDQHDIANLIKQYGKIDLSDLNLSEDKISVKQKLAEALKPSHNNR